MADGSATPVVRATGWPAAAGHDTLLFGPQPDSSAGQSHMGMQPKILPLPLRATTFTHLQSLIRSPPPPCGEVGEPCRLTDRFRSVRAGWGDGAAFRTRRVLHRCPPPEKFCAALEFFDFPTRWRWVSENEAFAFQSKTITLWQYAPLRERKALSPERRSRRVSRRTGSAA